MYHDILNIGARSFSLVEPHLTMLALLLFYILMPMRNKHSEDPSPTHRETLEGPNVDVENPLSPWLRIGYCLSAMVFHGPPRFRLRFDLYDQFRLHKEHCIRLAVIHERWARNHRFILWCMKQIHRTDPFVTKVYDTLRVYDLLAAQALRDLQASRCWPYVRFAFQFALGYIITKLALAFALSIIPVAAAASVDFVPHLGRENYHPAPFTTNTIPDPDLPSCVSTARYLAVFATVSIGMTSRTRDLIIFVMLTALVASNKPMIAAWMLWLTICLVRHLRSLKPNAPPPAYTLKEAVLWEALVHAVKTDNPRDRKSVV